MRLTPVPDSASTRATLLAVGTGASFCSPSRGPTSRSDSRSGRSVSTSMGSQSAAHSRPTPGQSGRRFSLKAATPSTRSPENAVARQAPSSTSSPVARSTSAPLRNARLALRTPTGEFAAIVAASSSAASRVGAGGDPAVDQAEPLGLGDVEPAAGEDQVGGPGGADPPGQQLGAAAAGDHPDRHLGQPEHRGLVAHDQVAGQRQLEAAAEREPVHRRDRSAPAGRGCRRTRRGSAAAAPAGRRR